MRTLALTGFVYTALALSAQAGMPMQPRVTLEPHRAVYDLSLAWASGQSGIEGLHGRFVYSFTGAACEGYVTEMRMVTDISREQGKMVTDQISSSFEDLEEGAFSFSNTMFTDYNLQSESAGEASRADDRSIAVSVGDEGPLDIGKGEFPTEYLSHVIDAAVAGRKLYQADSFDGSGKSLLRAVTLIGNRAEIAGSPQWPITTAYFSTGAGGDQTPDYTISMSLAENGVSRDLLMDFGDFKMAGKLAKLEMLDPARCDDQPTTAANKR